MSRITINGISVDPLVHAQALRTAGLMADDASESDYILIQTSQPLTSDQQADLAGKGVAVAEYVSENTYLCHYKPEDLAPIRNLSYVTWANVYMKGFKVAPSLRSTAVNVAEHILPMSLTESHSRTIRLVDVVFHDNVAPDSEKLKAELATAAHVDPDGLVMGRNKVRLHVQERYLDDVAAIDEVRVIEEVPAVKLRNSVARPILNAHVVINTTTFEGAGQVVAVADTGFDKGSTSNVHPAFTGRVKKLYALGRPGKMDDPEGHGTHVCGSVLGNGNSPSMGGAIQGTAPKATLVLQSLLDTSGGLGGIPADLHNLFSPPYTNDGARVHTNSWGSTTPSLPYGQSSREIDDFVWNHQDCVICFAAGNDGTDANGDGSVDPASVGSESAAKNCITVGASESLRPDIRTTYGTIRPTDFPKPPIHDDPMANHPEGMAAFSSRGPTQEHRIKPDVVSPGTSILSTRSRNALSVPTIFGTSLDKAFFFDSGTSMATPLTAGCAAVLRETLVKNGTSTPSAALIKALMINGAVELPGQYSPTEAGTSPNSNSGWGRVNLAGSVIIPGPNPDGGFGDEPPLKQGESATFPVNIPPGHQPGAVVAGAGTTGLSPTFKITLVWSDPPGANLQNDLDLILIASDGTERHGNAGTTKNFDRINNVEQIVWMNIPPGPAKIVIRAFRITLFPQPYAYAWRIS